MNTPVIISPRADLIEEVVRHLEPEGADYSRNLVVFPGKRPAHFLRKAIGVKQGQSFIPPRIFSIDSFVDFLYKERLDLAQREIQPLDAVAMLHAIYLRVPDRFDGTSFDALDAFLPLGLRLFSELEELKMAHLPPQKIREAIGAITVGNLQPMATVYEQFYEEIGKRRMCTRALKYATVADFLTDQHLDGFARVIAAGFFGLTNVETVIMQKLRRLDHAIMIFQYGPGLEEHVGRAGLGKVKPLRQNGPPPDVFFHQAPDTHGQVFGLASLLHGIKDNHAAVDERTVIVLPSSESLAPVYQFALPLFDESEYNISLGYPVIRTPVYGFLNALMNLAGTMHEGKFHARQYLQFLLHPYVKNILFEGRADVMRILAHTIEEQFARGRFNLFFDLEEIEQSIELSDRAASRILGVGIQCPAENLRAHMTVLHARTIRRLLDCKTIGDVAQVCREALLFVDHDSTARYHPLFRPFVEAAVNVLEEISSSLLATGSVADMNTAYTLVRRSLALASVPFPGTPLKGLQVLGFLETRNLKFDTVYLLDANEDALPGGGSEHTIIPEQVRERLGLPTRKQHDEIATYHFNILIQGARTVHLFFAESPQREKSRFVEQLLWERQRKDEVDDVTAYIDTVSYNVQLANSVPAAIPKTAGMVEMLQHMAFSATALDAYLACQLRFYYRYVLGLKQQEDVVGDIDSGDVGGFVHEALRSFFAGLIGKPLALHDLDVPRLLALIDTGYTERFGKEMTGSRYVMKQQIQTHLANFIEHYQKVMLGRSSVTLLAVEQKFEIQRGKFRLAGKLDRVERRGDHVFILDYKTGKPDSIKGVDFGKLDIRQRETWKDAVSSLQLPLYAMLYAGGTGTPIEQTIPAYLKLGQALLDEEIEVPMFTGGIQPAEAYGKLEDLLDRLLEEVTNVAMPFAPTDRFDRDCTYCPFQTICGTQWAQRTV